MVLVARLFAFISLSMWVSLRIILAHLYTQITWADSDMSIRSEMLASASGVFRGVGIPVLRCLGC